MTPHSEDILLTSQGLANLFGCPCYTEPNENGYTVTNTDSPSTILPDTRHKAESFLHAMAIAVTYLKDHDLEEYHVYIKAVLLLNEVGFPLTMSDTARKVILGTATTIRREGGAATRRGLEYAVKRARSG